MISIKSLLTIFGLYFLTFFSYYFFIGSFDFYFIGITTIIALILASNYIPLQLPYLDTLRIFLAHYLLVLLSVNLIVFLIKFITGIVFYFGFYTTFVCYLSSLIVIKEGIIEKILDNLPYRDICTSIASTLYMYYTEYIVPLEISKHICQIIAYLYPFFFDILYDANQELSDNYISQLLLTEISNRVLMFKKVAIEKTSTYIMRQMIKSPVPHVAMRSMTLESQYKIPNLNLDMSFLESTQLNINDMIDDLDDDDDESSESLNVSSADEMSNVNIPVDSQKVMETSAMETSAMETSVFETPTVQTHPLSDSVIRVNDMAKNLQTQAQRRALLKKKIAEKKADRSNGAKPVPNSVRNLSKSLDIPNIDKIMQDMMVGDNLKNLLAQAKADGGNIPNNINADEMKNVLQSLMKN